MKIALESCFEKHAQEVWERHWMNLEVQTTLLNTFPPILIPTSLKALGQHLQENDQLVAVDEFAGPVPAIPIEYEQILKDGGGFWYDVIGGSLPEDLALAARREETAWAHSEGVYEIAPLQNFLDAGKQLLD